MTIPGRGRLKVFLGYAAGVGKTYQMLRLTLHRSLNVIPEISANRYMLWARFTTQDGDQKPKPYEEDVSFDLTLCNF